MDCTNILQPVRDGFRPPLASALVSSYLGASRESLPCGQLLSFLQKNIISATVAMAAVLLVTVLVVFTLVTYKRRRQTK